MSSLGIVTQLSAAPPIEPAQRAIGRRTVVMVDAAREGRALTVDVWYPAIADAAATPTTYEPLSGIEFIAAAALAGPAAEPGSFPLVLISHGRTGMRFANALLAESLAARGNIVVSPDHPGDTTTDWMSGTFHDDRTNELGRVADSRFLIDTFVAADHAVSGIPADLLGAVDSARIAVIGHSYGAYTALAAVAGVRGVAPDHRIGAVIGLQPYTRTMSDAALARVRTPTLLLISEFDQTTPAATDGDRPWQLVDASPTWRIDLGGAAHHASSDMGLYLELAGQLPDLPPMVMAYVAMMNGEMSGPQYRPWREALALVIRSVSAFIDIVLDVDPTRGEAEAEMLAATPGLQLQRRAGSPR